MQVFAREARWVFLVTAALAAVFYWWAGWWASVLVLAFFALALFWLREPHRQPPPRALDVLSPIDGQLLGVENTRDPYLHRPALRLRMQQSWLGANVVFSPTEGKLEQVWGVHNDERPGHVALWVRTDEGDDLLLEIKTRLAYSSPWVFNWIRLTRFSPGERVGQGQCLGIIGPVAECSLYLADTSRALLESGSSLRGAEQSLAQYRH